MKRRKKEPKIVQNKIDQQNKETDIWKGLM